MKSWLQKFYDRNPYIILVSQLGEDTFPVWLGIRTSRQPPLMDKNASHS